jgi:hypothetical protein
MNTAPPQGRAAPKQPFVCKSSVAVQQLNLLIANGSVQFFGEFAGMRHFVHIYVIEMIKEKK